jgi:L-lactate dehydrogenase complex protein LldG
MNSRESILAAVKRSQPDLIPLVEPSIVLNTYNKLERFQTVLESIGAKVHFLNGDDKIGDYIKALFPEAKRVISIVSSIESYYISNTETIVHHSLQDVDVAIIKAQFGVAENGAVWVTEDDLKIRVIPFIGEHLVAVVDAEEIVSNMHEAYERIGSADYGFGVFIAGPSKTADIEQSLVLGAHGPKSMTILIRDRLAKKWTM